MKHLRLTLTKVTRTDLICIVCGRFRTEYQVAPEAGIHRDCIAEVHIKRQYKEES